LRSSQDSAFASAAFQDDFSLALVEGFPFLLKSGAMKLESFCEVVVVLLD
jgi:hypothetical protein